MRIASLAEVKAKLSAYLQEAESAGPVVITRNGKAVAVLLAPVDDDDLERLLLSRSPRFRTLVRRSRASIQAGKGVPHATFWRDAGERQAQRHPAAQQPHAPDEAATARRPVARKRRR